MDRQNVTFYLLFSVHRCMFCANRSCVGSEISMTVVVDGRKYYAGIAQYYWPSGFHKNIVSNFIWFTHTHCIALLYSRQAKTEPSVDSTVQYLFVCLSSSKHASKLVIQMDWADTVLTDCWCSEVSEVAKQRRGVDGRWLGVSARILYSWFRASSLYINKIQQDATDAGIYYCRLTLHVSGVHRTHHQEHIKL